MRIGRFTVSASSIVLLVFQLMLVSAIAGKYLYQRWRCPRVWTRAVAYDPDLVMRGRYLSLQLTVDGCQSTLPKASQARFPRDINGAAVPGPYAVQASQRVDFLARLEVQGGKLEAIRIPDEDKGGRGLMISGVPGAPCDQMRVNQPVDLYIAEHARNPVPVKAGQELWVEVTLPPKGSPRPTQLAIKQNGVWTPLAFN
jgi:uncharacterized membrane-anchored protein